MMLDEERKNEIKKLAIKIRNENEDFFSEIKDMNKDDSIREKNDFIDFIMEETAKYFSSGLQGKEERKIFRANILIPETEEFLKRYNSNQNVHNLMEHYKVSIEDIFEKINEVKTFDINENDIDNLAQQLDKITEDDKDMILKELEASVLFNEEPEIEENPIVKTPPKKDSKEKILYEDNTDMDYESQLKKYDEAITNFIDTFSEKQQKFSAFENEKKEMEKNISDLTKENEQLKKQVSLLEKNLNKYASLLKRVCDKLPK